MSLSAGTKLGPYEILAPLGAGGMGEVYKARDTRLGRDVAIKVLPASFARDADRMRRFEQEARAIAALSHPNVLAIYDTGTHEGMPYLVSELLEGESLRARLNNGPVHARKAVEYAQQVADGLAAAHEKAIVHRDLKPENLFLTSGGRIKILDFGLAKIEVAQAASATDGETAGMTAGTTPGVVMGTSGYMAPEQVRGEAVDHRADIFSFGATLYEMLSGHRAFTGQSSIETMNSILKDEPPQLDQEKLHVAPGLERIIAHCLEKKPADRFQSARDLTFALGTLTGSQVATTSHVALKARRNWMIWAFGAAAVALLVMVAALLTRSAPSGREVFAIAVPGEVSHLAVSPDGKWLAFVTPGESNAAPMVYVQRIGSPTARALPGTEDASYPFWSPDDVYIAFYANNKLQKVAVAGGETQTIANNVVAARGGTWGSKGVIIYTPDAGGPLRRVNADGTGNAPLTDKIMAPKEASHRWPYFLPDGDHFLMWAGDFSGNTVDQESGLFLSSLSHLEKIKLQTTLSSGAYADGRLYYADANHALVSVPMSVRSEKLTGEPTVVAPQVAVSASTVYASFSVSQDSTIVYSTSGGANLSQFTWFDLTGKEVGRVEQPAIQANPALSPDGTKLAYDSNEDIWIADLRRGTSSRFTFAPTEETTPIWSRDGATIAYRDLAPPVIHLKKANGLEQDHKLEKSAAGSSDDILPNSWSADGRELICSKQSVITGWHLVATSTAEGTTRQFLPSSGYVTNGQISPDGKWVVYDSNETGDSEIYVTTFPNAAGKWQVSRGGGTEPRWRGDGKEIFYIGPKQMLTAVTVSTEGTFSTDVPRPLFTVHPRAPISSTDQFNYDVTKDGKRFLVNQYVRPQQIPPLNIILHADAAAK